MPSSAARSWRNRVRWRGRSSTRRSSICWSRATPPARRSSPTRWRNWSSNSTSTTGEQAIQDAARVQCRGARRGRGLRPDQEGRLSHRGLTPEKTNWGIRLAQPPFLAYSATGGITFTFGGVKVNENAQVIGTDWRPLKGLYACGEMIGGLFYDNYPAGTGLVSGATFGRIAGRKPPRRLEDRNETRRCDQAPRCHALAQEIAERIHRLRYEDLTPTALEWTRTAFIDTVGVTLAGMVEDGPRILMNVPGIATRPAQPDLRHRPAHQRARCRSGQRRGLARAGL